MVSLLNSLLLLTIFLTPLLGAYKSLGYEQIKVFFFIVSISLIAFLWLLKKTEIKLSRIGWVSALFIITLILTSLLGLDFRGSFLGNLPYFQGSVVYCYLFLFSIIVSSLKINLKYYAFIFSSSALIVSSLAIEDWILKNSGFSIPNYAGRVVSTFGQPNFFAGFLLLTLPFSYYLYRDPNRRLNYLGFLGGLISIVGIFVSYSRTAIFLSLILLVIALFSSLSFRTRSGIYINKWIPAFAGMAVLIVVSFAIYLSIHFSSGFIGNEFSKPLSTKNPDLTKEGVEQRVYIWPQFIKIGMQKPLFGYGLENINLSFKNYFEKNKHKIFEENLNIEPVLISMKELVIDRTHNYILDLLIFSGVLGVIIWLLLIGLLIKKCKNKYLLIGLLTYLIWIQFQNQSIVQLIYFWLIVGLIDQNS